MGACFSVPIYSTNTLKVAMAIKLLFISATKVKKQITQIGLVASHYKMVLKCSAKIVHVRLDFKG
jgi:hypothetical protein